MSSAYKERVKEVNENFKQNAQSVQQMISDMESEIFALLKKKEKLREKVVALREEKRLQPSMRDRTAILVDDVADFANLYNLRQPPETKIPGVSVSSSGDRPVIGEGPKLTRHLVLEMNPLDVVDQTPPATPLSPKNSAISGSPRAAAAELMSDNASQVSGSVFSLGSAGGHNVQPVEQPSVACSLGLAFRSLNFPYVPPGTKVVLNQQDIHTLNNPSPPSASASATDKKNIIQVDPTEAPILGLRFSLVIPASTGCDLEGIRDKIQNKIDNQISEIRASIESASNTFNDAKEKAEKESAASAGEDETQKKNEKEDTKNDDDLNLDEVGDLLWNSLRLVVGVTKGNSAHPSRFSVAIVTIYVYRILTPEQKAKQEKIAQQMESKLNAAVKEAGVSDDDIKEARDFTTKSRMGRQLSAICRLVADSNFSVNAELQITAASLTNNNKNGTPGSSPKSLKENVEKTVAGLAANAEKALDDGTKKPSQIPNNTSNESNNDDSSALQLLKMERKAEDLATRAFDSLPRIEKAVKEAFKYLSDAVASKKKELGNGNNNDEENEVAETKKKGVEQAQLLYKEHILPAIQRNIDPEDKVIKLINQLVGGSEPYFRPLKNPDGSMTLTPVTSSSANASPSSAPFSITLNAHHTELFNLPKQLVRQTANMIYDYFLDTTASLSGRAYIGMCRRRTLAGVALYDALHFNVVPLQQGSKSDTAKSACAFYHSEKIMRDAIIRMVETAVEQAISAKSKMSKAIDEETADDGKKLQERVGKVKESAEKLGFLNASSLAGVTKDSILASTLSTLKLAMNIGKNLFTKFKEDREQKQKEEEERKRKSEEDDEENIGKAADDDDDDNDKQPTHAFAFVDGQVCCCDAGRPLEIDIFMPDSRAVATFKMVLRPARPDMMSPRIRARRKDAKSAQAQAATLVSQTCTGYCTAALPEFGLQIGEAFANVWLTEIEEYVNNNNDNSDDEKKKE